MIYKKLRKRPFLAIFKLDRPAMYDWHVSPVCLPLRDQEPEPGTKAMVAGWGATHPDSTTRPRELQAKFVQFCVFPRISAHKFLLFQSLKHELKHKMHKILLGY